MLNKNKRRSKELAEIFTLDIETDSKGELIDIGFYNGELIRYFQDWGNFTEHLSTIKNDALVYAHNGGGFDYVNYFIWLFKNKMEFSAMLKSSKIFAFSIDKFPNIKFVDSFCLLPMSLDKIAKSFCELDKISIDTKDIQNMRYFKEKNKRKYYEYLERDCVSLYDSIVKLRALVNDVYNIGNLPLSIGGTSMRLFMREFLNHKIIVPSAKEKEFTFRSYVGGRCEYLGFGYQNKNGWYENVNGYDFNSHYPAQMISAKFPIRRGIKTSKGVFDSKGFLESGIYECSFNQKHGRIPLLKTESGDYEFSGSGVYTHFELNEIIKGGGNVDIISGYYYELNEDIFSKFVNFFFSERLKAQALNDTAKDVLYKLILNNLYGKFGQRDEVQSIQIINEDDVRDLLLENKKLNEFHRIDDYHAFYEVTENKTCHTSFPAIASYITALGRIKLVNTIELSENPIYCDTDSIHCIGELPSELLGDKLGQLKTEFLNSQARYGGKKSYEIKDDKLRQKGIPSASLNSGVFDELFNKGFIEVSYKRPLLLKSAIRKIETQSPSEFTEFTRTIKCEPSYFEKISAQENC